MASKKIIPMETAGTEHLIERTYRESGALQWVRETYKNAEEAGATRIEFGIEWQAVENKGVYRRMIADNGCGMNPDELVGFFNTFGGGGKPIGGVHENFGVGSKTSLLPWNHHGLVVISYKEGQGSMIWVMRDSDTGEYGLKLFDVPYDEGMTRQDEVYAPFADDEHGCDWSTVKPEWIEEHGTVLILLGNDPTNNTVLGDPERDEADIKAISKYLNGRLWKVPDGVEIYVDELRTGDAKKWPRSNDEAHTARAAEGEAYDRRTNRRRIRGAQYYIEYSRDGFDRGHLASSGTVPLSDGSEIDWYLWEGERPHVHVEAENVGYIAAVYKNELFDFTQHNSTYRSFGVAEASVRSKLWLIVRPPLFDEASKEGVYPRQDRSSLLMKGGATPGRPLPMNDWAGEFSESMPEAVRDALRAARSGSGDIEDEQWRDRLAERFGSRWKIKKVRVDPTGTDTVDPGNAGTQPRPKPVKRGGTGTSPGGTGGRGGTEVLGPSGGSTPGRSVRVAGGIPSYRLVGSGEVEDGMLAAWLPHEPDHPEGVVLINQDHPILLGQVEYWQNQYPDHVADKVAAEVLSAYGEIGVAKVAHSEHLKGDIPTSIVNDQLRSPEALTMSLLGLMAEETFISARLGGRVPSKKRSVA